MAKQYFTTEIGGLRSSDTRSYTHAIAVQTDRAGWLQKTKDKKIAKHDIESFEYNKRQAEQWKNEGKKDYDFQSDEHLNELVIKLEPFATAQEYFEHNKREEIARAEKEAAKGEEWYISSWSQSLSNAQKNLNQHFSDGHKVAKILPAIPCNKKGEPLTK